MHGADLACVAEVAPQQSLRRFMATRFMPPSSSMTSIRCCAVAVAMVQLMWVLPMYTTGASCKLVTWQVDENQVGRQQLTIVPRRFVDLFCTG